ncbi:hypothetical protein CLOSTMETH_00807 [[Clostridium] methylpentosum DSM 5476]|uniref:Uncharacterized protein n=1 Tax=[Clostridium] methylpentosum DSM 5476 TaxID=537013 RepID=C0EAF2_9FIRM|nr:hypothetical protein CLOSTMETH_00807 [[Clostridium] methylpentosum DSM 5476]
MPIRRCLSLRKNRAEVGTFASQTNWAVFESKGGLRGRAVRVTLFQKTYCEKDYFQQQKNTAIVNRLHNFRKRNK